MERLSAAGQMDQVSAEDIVGMMIGRELKDIYPRSEHTPGDPILEITALESETKLNHANLTLRRGEVLGIAGLNRAVVVQI